MRGIKRKNWLNNSRCWFWLGWVGEVGGGGRLGGGGVAARYLRRQTIFPQMALCVHRLWQHICVIRMIFDNTCQHAGRVCLMHRRVGRPANRKPTAERRRRTFSFSSASRSIIQEVRRIIARHISIQCNVSEPD